MGVANVVAELRPLAADITNLRHDCSREDQNSMREPRSYRMFGPFDNWSCGGFRLLSETSCRGGERDL
jgi:hypothetical protein